MLDDALVMLQPSNYAPASRSEARLRRVLDAIRGTCGATNARDGPAGSFTSNRQGRNDLVTMMHDLQQGVAGMVVTGHRLTRAEKRIKDFFPRHYIS